MEENHVEGNLLLDPVLKKKLEEKQKKQKEEAEKKKQIKESIEASLTEIAESHGMKIFALAYSPEFDMIGNFNSKNVNYIDRLGFMNSLKQD